MQLPQFNSYDIEQQFLDFLRSNGLEPIGNFSLHMDGQLHRYRLEGDTPSERSGAYILHDDGLPAGFVQDWRNGIKLTWCFSPNNLNDEQRAYFNSPEFKKLQEEKRIKQENERRIKYENAAREAKKVWDSLLPADISHPYLSRKNVNNYGLRFNRFTNCLAVPLADIHGNIKSIQWLPADKEQIKLFFDGALLDGLFWNVALDTITNEPNETILLGEGYATMAKIYELTGMPCVAALSCYRLKEIAKILRETYSKVKIIITSDNDKGTEMKRGVNSGIKCANDAINAGYADGIATPQFSSPEDGTDWDDFALKYGDEVCVTKLRNTISSSIVTLRQQKYLALAQEYGVMSGSSFADFCKPPEGEDFIIQDWLPNEALTMMFAPSGSGKGFVTLDMAFAVACEDIHEWHGHKVVKHGPVVYLAGEGQRGMRKRCAGLANYKGINPANIQMHFITDTIALDDKHPQYGIQKAIANIGMRCPEPALVIIDTVNCYMQGDENQTSDTSAFLRACKQIIEEFHCTVKLIHHTGHSPEKQGRARGSSVFKGAMDMEYRITKTGQIITLENSKNKDNEEQSPMVFRMVEVPVPNFYNSMGWQEKTCVIEFDEQTTKVLGNQDTPKEKITKTEQFARDTYKEAAAKFGVIIHDEETNADVAAVDTENWREVFYRRCAADKEGVRRVQFNRARKILLEDKKILFKKELYKKEFYCLVPSGEPYETSIFYSIRHQDENDISR